MGVSQVAKAGLLAAEFVWRVALKVEGLAPAASFQPEGVTVETATKPGNVREAVRNCHEVIVAGALVRSPRPRPE